MVTAETILTRDEVLKILTESEYTNVSFYKVNGDIRDMVCTLNADQLALLARANPDAGLGLVEAATDHPDYDENQVRVYDVEAEGWRSFLLTNLISIEGNNL